MREFHVAYTWKGPNGHGSGDIEFAIDGPITRASIDLFRAQIAKLCGEDASVSIVSWQEYGK